MRESWTPTQDHCIHRHKYPVVTEEEEGSPTAAAEVSCADHLYLTTILLRVHYRNKVQRTDRLMPATT